MSAKKESIEDRMSQSIFYNLSILRHAVKTTPDFDESLSPTMFLKSNTKAFIHITHFLFNIIDHKEFKSKFYWPIVEKKAENSYRVSSVDFINYLIDKHNLQQEKIKLVLVVHPCGKRFMSLILELIQLAIKDIMRRRKYAPEKSFDIEKVTQACTNMKEVETNLVESIRSETKIVRDKIDVIRNLLKSIFPSKDIPMTFQEFIESWHASNKRQFEQIRSRNGKMNEIYMKTEELQVKAAELLTLKKYSVELPAPEIICDVMEFYENGGESGNNQTPAADNILWLIAQLDIVLPAIEKYLKTSSLDVSDSASDELRVLRRLAAEVGKIEENFDLFVERFRKTIPPMIEKLKKAKEEREAENPPEIDPIKDQLDRENLKILNSPKYYFDASKDCLKNVMVKKNRLALLDDDEGKENKNESKLFLPPPKSPQVNKALKLNQTLGNHMGPPVRQPKKRLDPMAMLERATSRKRGDLNATSKTAGAIPKHMPCPGFSSTMLSPDFRQTLFNCSTVSSIGKASPTVESMFPDAVNIVVTPAEPKIANNDTIPWDDSEKMESLQRSPKGGLKMLVSLEEVFSVKSFEKTVTSTDSMEKTLKESGSDSYSCTSMILNNDEDLFNVSDTLLQEIED